MKITHLSHSGFLVELPHTLLLFDWYQGNLPPLDAQKALYVFVSHRHPDHYSKKIWQLAGRCIQTHYILFHDVCKEPPCPVCAVRAHETYEIGSLTVRTLLSTDEGVAYLVEAEGKTIYHAGDLNLWRWEGAPERDNRWQTGTYRAEIRRLAGHTIDAAFLTLDPRQKDDAPLGMAWFLAHTDTRLAIPMHYWDQKERAADYLKQPPLAAYADRICLDDCIVTDEPAR